VNTSGAPSFVGGARISLAGATDRGRRREHNEDALVLDASYGLAVVADGVGGEQAGEVASAMAVRVVQEAVRKRLLAMVGDYVDSMRLLPEELSLIVRAALIDAHSEVLTQGSAVGSKGMSSTVTAIFVHDEVAVIGWAGDSPAFVLRDGRLAQLTRSHNVQQDIAAGRGHGQEPRRKGALTMVVGGGGDPFMPDVYCKSLSAGDILLACSDGLTDVLDDARITAIIERRRHDLDGAALALIAAANEAGAEDNITVALVRIESAPVGLSTSTTSAGPAVPTGLFTATRKSSGAARLPLHSIAVSACALTAGLMLGAGLAVALRPDPAKFSHSYTDPTLRSAPKPGDADAATTGATPAAATAASKAPIPEPAPRVAPVSPTVVAAPVANGDASAPVAVKPAKPQPKKKPHASKSAAVPTGSSNPD
jgi:serine/threonine protein phosphatase PrpC